MPLSSVIPLSFIGVATAVSLWCLNKRYPLVYKLLACLWCLMFAVELVGHLKLSTRSNHWFYNVFNVFFFAGIALVLSVAIERSVARIIIKVSVALFFVFFVINTSLNGLHHYQTLTVVVGNLFIISICAVYFRQLYRADSGNKIHHDPFFWFCCGFTLYFGGTTPFLGMLNYLIAHYPDFTRLYFIYVSNGFSVLLNIAIITGYLTLYNHHNLKSPYPGYTA